jgi:hypothetical protein
MDTVRQTLARGLAPFAHRWPLRPLLARPRPRRIILVAIVRNEFDYLLEWIAWHRARGFTRFIIGEHESDDGTSELLEALESCGLIEGRFLISGNEQAPQRSFYNRVIRELPRGADPILGFLDADEFVMGRRNGNLARSVARVFRDDTVSALAINWRVQGSSGYQRENAGPVVWRFGGHASQEFEKNRHLKSFVRRSRLAYMEIHNARLRSGRYVDARGRALEPEQPDALHRSAAVHWDGLFVAHFVLKSRSEFDRHKRNRGSAAQGSQAVKGDRYFRAHDRFEQFTPVGRRAFRTMMKEQGRILECLQGRSLYHRPCHGGAVVDEGTRTVQGWLAYAGPRVDPVQVVMRSAGREWRCPAFEHGAWQAPEGGARLPKLSFSLPLAALGQVDPSSLELRPFGSSVRLRLD